MDTNSPWEENPDIGHVPQVEWTRITSEFTNSGYREGIIAGKEAFLQKGFDVGFANVGVPLGRELGNLRGTAAAIRSLLHAQTSEPFDLEEIRNISSALSTIRFSDLAPPDLDAEQHAKEHLHFVDLVTDSTDLWTETTSSESHTIEEIRVAKLKERLDVLCTKLGLNGA